MDEDTMKAGLLMEAAQSHQKLAEASLKRLKAHTHDLEQLVRDEVRRAVVEELQALAADSQRAASALQRLKRSADARVVVWNVGITLLCSLLALGTACWVLPSRREIAALRSKRDEFAAALAQLGSEGGRIDLRRCGSEQRLCVRVDRTAPVYGKSADYLIVKGY